MHRIVRRVQAKSNPERLRRRLAKRKNITLEQARELIPENAAQKLNLPFVTLQSASTGKLFRLFIEHMPVQPESQNGDFSFYGLSSTATVPWF
jgi:CRISPR-associated endonuclease Csy4